MTIQQALRKLAELKLVDPVAFHNHMIEHHGRQWRDDPTLCETFPPNSVSEAMLTMSEQQFEAYMEWQRDNPDADSRFSFSSHPLSKLAKLKLHDPETFRDRLEEFVASNELIDWRFLPGTCCSECFPEGNSFLEATLDDINTGDLAVHETATLNDLYPLDTDDPHDPYDPDPGPCGEECHDCAGDGLCNRKSSTDVNHPDMTPEELEAYIEHLNGSAKAELDAENAWLDHAENGGAV